MLLRAIDFKRNSNNIPKDCEPRSIVGAVFKAEIAEGTEKDERASVARPIK